MCIVHTIRLTRCKENIFAADYRQCKPYAYLGFRTFISNRMKLIFTSFVCFELPGFRKVYFRLFGMNLKMSTYSETAAQLKFSTEICSQLPVNF